jgi:serine/threonine protein kinase
VSYFGSCATEKKLWILMDYCGLGSVRDVMETCKRTLTEKEIACVCAGTLQGLHYLHTHFEQPIIHKDIKSANILLTEQGEFKLADFGVSQQILTTLCLGYLEGTPHFMAPEIGNASRFNFKADIWSLGITAIEMADGRPPYADINIMRAIHMIRRHSPPTLKDPKKWSKDFNDFISRCLVKDFDARSTAEELLQHPFILGARPQAMRDLCHEAVKAKKKARSKIKKEVSSRSQKYPSSPSQSSVSRWRTDKKAKSLIVPTTVESDSKNHGSVVILSTVNVRGRTYHSASEDSSLTLAYVPFLSLRTPFIS